MIYFSADHHFGHRNIIDYCKRPFESVEEMNMVLVNYWNQTVKPEDKVFYVGDFSFYGHENFVSLLNGNIVFIRGNHDKKNLTTIVNLTLSKDGHSYFLTHKPENSHLLMPTLCGHVHDLWKSMLTLSFPIINVGVDAWGFKPVSFDEISNYVKELKIKCSESKS